MMMMSRLRVMAIYDDTVMVKVQVTRMMVTPRMITVMVTAILLALLVAA